jgi:hypothetical protein
VSYWHRHCRREHTLTVPHATEQAATTYLLTHGLVAHPDAVAAADQVRDAHGERKIVVRLSGGLSFEVLPDAGLDVGGVWWSGYPVAWRSPSPAHRAATDREPAWVTAWTGGLVTTAGPDNIGVPRAGFGQHGSYHRIPAEEVAVQRLDGPRGAGFVVRGAVRNVEAFGRRVTVHREIEAWTDSGTLEVRDVVANDGVEPVAVPLLYHMNVGAPFVTPGATVEFDAHGTDAREEHPTVPDPHVLPEPSDEIREAVFEHALDAPSVTVRSVALGATMRFTWTGDTLPRFFEWVWPTRGGWVLGIEPANAPMWGPDRDVEPGAGAPVLAPGEQIRTAVTIAIEG